MVCSIARFKQVVLAVGLLLEVACTHTRQVITPQGLVEERTSYPQYEPIRTQKQIKLALADQDQFRRYYRRYHSWPLSEQGFVAASDTNYRLVADLHRRGFTDLEFVSRGPDSLRVRYTFQTLGNLRYDYGEKDKIQGLGRAFTGSFVFVADPVSGISFQQIMDKRRREWYWPFLWRPFDRKPRRNGRR